MSDANFEIMKARAEGYRQAREDITAAIESGGPVFLTEHADLRDADTITLIDGQRNEHAYEKTPQGYWEPMDREDYPLPHPMLVCSECQKTNHYPGKYCTYCGSDNKKEGEV
jgi:hypothetical protein